MKPLKPIDTLILNELTNFEVRLPREKKIKKLKQSHKNSGSPFGCGLPEQEWISNPFVPKFLFLCTTYLSDHVEADCIFRKAGSKARQRELKAKFEKGDLKQLEEIDPHDIASLLKQWLRELPNPIITPFICEVLIRCQNVEKTFESTILTCLLLPPENLCVLEHLLEFLYKVSQKFPTNKMDAHNLATIMAPNLFPKDTIYLNQIISIMELLIKSASHVGRIPNFLAQKMDSKLMEQQKIFEKQHGTFEDVMSRFLKCFSNSPLLKPTICIERFGNKRRAEIMSDGLLVKRPCIESCTPTKVLTPSNCQTANCSLKRGRPNTIGTGLPSSSYQNKDASFIVFAGNYSSSMKENGSFAFDGPESESKEEEWEIDL